MVSISPSQHALSILTIEIVVAIYFITFPSKIINCHKVSPFDAVT